MVDLKKLIAAQRKKMSVVEESVLEVEFGGAKLEIGIAKSTPDEWDALVGANPPRHGHEGDSMVGYNQTAVAKAYPHVAVDGDDVSPDEWAEMFGLLDPAWRNSVGVTIWGVNINQSILALKALGKASAGQRSPSPAK